MFTGSVHRPFSKVVFQMSMPPCPPLRLLTKYRVFPSIENVGFDSHAPLFTVGPRFRGLLQLPPRFTHMYRSHRPPPSARLQAVKNMILPSCEMHCAPSLSVLFTGSGIRVALPQVPSFQLLVYRSSSICVLAVVVLFRGKRRVKTSVPPSAVSDGRYSSSALFTPAPRFCGSKATGWARASFLKRALVRHRSASTRSSSSFLFSRIKVSRQLIASSKCPSVSSSLPSCSHAGTKKSLLCSTTFRRCSLASARSSLHVGHCTSPDVSTNTASASCSRSAITRWASKNPSSSFSACSSVFLAASLFPW